MSAAAPAPASSQWAGQGLRFLLFGLFNTALTYAVYCVLVWLMHPQWAYALVFAGGIALAYWGNSRWVFRTQHTVQRALLYPLVYLLQYAVNAGLLFVATQRYGLGPRLGLALALAVGTPISFLLNRMFLTTIWRPEHGKHALGLGLALLTTLALYAQGMHGWWHGDDLSHVHRLYVAAQDGNWAQQAASWFTSSFAPDSAFYRPLFMAQLALTYAIAGIHYPTWYAMGLALHLANVALAYLLIVRLAAHQRTTAYFAATATALMFGLMAEHAEGVYWQLARADAWVGLFSLLGLWCWLGRADDPDRRSAWLLPACLMLALGFKESAALLALQMLCMALLWPWATTRVQRRAVAYCVGLMLAYFAWRGYLFGHATQVYSSSNAVNPIARALQALASLPSWWLGLTSTLPSSLRAVSLWPVALGMLLLALVFAATTRLAAMRRVTLVMLTAWAGMLLATLWNLGGVSATGEGGRLWYVPDAWLALALGVMLLSAQSPWRRAIGVIASVLLLTAMVPQTLALQRAAQRVQHDMRQLADSVPIWASKHPGLTLLIVPDHVGPIVMGRNAQGGLVLPPVQAQGYLHRVLPTLPQELVARHAQLQQGLATRLDELQPSALNTMVLTRMLEPTGSARWPDHYACWNVAQRSLRPLPTPTTTDASDWTAELERAARACALAPSPD